MKNFYDATNDIKNRNTTIDIVFPETDILLKMFEQNAEKFRHNGYISFCVDASWKELIQYDKKSDCIPYYIAAIVRNPIQKEYYFKD